MECAPGTRRPSSGRALNPSFSSRSFESWADGAKPAKCSAFRTDARIERREIASAVFRRAAADHIPTRGLLTCRVDEVQEAGRNNTWNLFLHEFSHPQSEFLFLMDSDLVFREKETLVQHVQGPPEGPAGDCVSTDRQYKDVYFKTRKSWRDRLSLATSDMTGTIQGRFSGQIYCIRAKVARRLYLPKDLGATDDGFIKWVVCSNFFTERHDPSRIVVAENASHIYEAYTSPADILRNQKRQMIGQATVYVLLEHVRRLPLRQRTNLREVLQATEAS